MLALTDFSITLQPAIAFLNTNSSLRYTLVIGILALLALFVFFYFRQQKPSHPALDFHAIAGENVNDTQLDLAKAYLEMGQKQAAKTILRQAAKQGSHFHKSRARELMKSL
jgi:FimV-like protein